ncbi:RNA 2',3'-cyclic phosphodiesterase [Methylobacterium nonmethylotrophicum]|uniref:RNA 2',3'-cyclic phosphodiesterase n=1 Tax=Methylobacterium nonmethylotrophicum TaxID=1141884 RepID=A0A4Z0P0J7_9HYPH|nr:RNA 2',3'-cyclic phosphodiesterase [Methylobacterium nonmethylotrophicum]TGE02683.1 RNA 2',3'-cyclic phosphodiesterase [Methylobacterium nonmethylotrophicum]
MPRLFTGIEVPPEAGLGLGALRGGLPGARWVEPADYHVTLRFIGDVDGGLADEIAEALAEAKARPPLMLTLDALAVFGGARPHALFARVVPDPGLSELQAEHERILRRLGVPPDTRRFTPHVTLARLKRGAGPDGVAQYLALQPVFPRVSFTATRAVLYSSRDSVGGGPYVVEAAYPLEEEG